MSNGIEMVCEMASEDSDWSFLLPLPLGMAFERLKLSPLRMQLAGTDISQYRLRFGLSLLHTDRVPFELLDSAAFLRRESCGGGWKIVFQNLTTII
jgi:hypothetical protein